MNALYIPETTLTPEISFDYAKGILSIVGYRSMPEVATKFYEPAINWIQAYTEQPKTSATELSIKLDYFNTSSGKCFVEIIKKLDQFSGKGHKVLLKWYYEQNDDDMLKIGEDIQIGISNLVIQKISY